MVVTNAEGSTMTQRETTTNRPADAWDRPAPRDRREPVGVCRWCGVLLGDVTVQRPDGTRRHLGCQ